MKKPYRALCIALAALAIGISGCAGNTDTTPPVVRFPHEGKTVVLLCDSYCNGTGAFTQPGNSPYMAASPDDPEPDQALDRPELPPSDNPTAEKNRRDSEGCFRHHNSFGELAFRMVNGAITGNVLNRGCAGATNKKLAEMSKGLTNAERAEVDLVIVTTGGNDLEFAKLVFNCIVGNDGLACRETLDWMRQNLKTVIQDGSANPDGSTKQLSSKAAIEQELRRFPNADFWWVGYPDVDGRMDRFLPCTCPDGGIFPAREIKAINDEAEQQQRDVVADLSRQFPGRIHFHSIRQLFANNLIGSAEPWIHLIVPDTYLNESFHPTAGGNLATAEDLLANDDFRRAISN